MPSPCARSPRRAGDSPNAAYRHFADRGDLVRGVSQAAMARVALTVEDEIAGRAPTDDPAADA